LGYGRGVKAKEEKKGKKKKRPRGDGEESTPRWSSKEVLLRGAARKPSLLNAGGDGIPRKDAIIRGEEKELHLRKGSTAHKRNGGKRSRTGAGPQTGGG